MGKLAPDAGSDGPSMYDQLGSDGSETVPNKTDIPEGGRETQEESDSWFGGCVSQLFGNAACGESLENAACRGQPEPPALTYDL